MCKYKPSLTRIETSYNPCCLNLGPFPSMVGGARDLAQKRKLIEASEFQSKGYILSRFPEYVEMFQPNCHFSELQIQKIMVPMVTRVPFYF